METNHEVTWVKDGDSARKVAEHLEDIYRNVTVGGGEVVNTIVVPSFTGEAATIYVVARYTDKS